MVTVGLLAFTVALCPLALLFALGRIWTLQVAYLRLSSIPVAALALQAVFARPMMRALGYAFILPPMLTCFVSLLFGIVGATLLATRPRSEPRRGLVIATMSRASPE